MTEQKLSPEAQRLQEALDAALKPIGQAFANFATHITTPRYTMAEIRAALVATGRCDGTDTLGDVQVQLEARRARAKL